MSGDRNIRTIVVAGGQIVGLSAAIAFARALPNAAVTVVDSAPDRDAMADSFPLSLAAGTRFHALIGLDENDLVRSAIASHFLGTEFSNWPGGVSWWHALGPYGKPAGAIPFDELWASAHAAGTALPFDRYSVGAALAREGKFIHPAPNPKFIGSRFAYGLRLEREAYCERLRTVAQSAAVQFHAGEIRGVEKAQKGHVAAVQLDDGESLQADLFIDCTGPKAILAREVDESFEDWSRWMPFGALDLAETEGREVPPPADKVSANFDGWTGEWPLRGRTLVARFRAGPAIRGRRLRPWSGNVLAIGDSATALDALHRFNLDLAHNAIMLALELLPGRDFDPLETGEYNRRAEQVTRRVRDFVALHYLRSGRSDGTWRDLAREAPPDSLARTLDQYRHRGRLPFHEEETISRDSWAAALLGLGVVPSHVDPQARNVTGPEINSAMDRLVAEIDTAVAGVPPYEDYLARMAR